MNLMEDFQNVADHCNYYDACLTTLISMVPY